MNDKRTFDDERPTNDREPGRNDRNERRGGNGRRNKPRRSNNKKQQGAETPAKPSGRTGSNSFNDLSWYGRNPELLASAAMLAFPSKPGLTVKEPQGIMLEENFTTAESRKQIPGIMQLKFEFTIGVSKDVTSPASIAAKEMWGYVRSKFSGSLGFDAPDLFMYLIGMDNIHAFISYCKRAYRAANVYSNSNFFMPEKLTEAVLGVVSNRSSINEQFQYSSFISNKVLLWNYINTLVNMSNKFVVPDEYDLFLRHRWMCEHVYADSATVQSQFYVFSPNSFFKVDDTGETGTRLVPMGDPLKYLYSGVAADPVTALFMYGKEMLDAMSNWEDAYDINGRLLRVFEGSQGFTSALLEQNEIIDIDYVPEVLMQINNLTVCPDFVQETITQNPSDNAVIYVPVLGTDQLRWNRTLINIPSVSPTPAEVTLATRLTSLGKADLALIEGIGDAPAFDFTCGSEIITAIYITFDEGRIPFSRNFFGTSWRGWFKMGDRVVNILSDPGNTTAYTQLQFDELMRTATLNCYESWQNAPMLCTIYHDLSGNVLDQPYITSFVDITNITNADFDFINDLHRVCLYSLFNCFGKSNATWKAK